MVDPFPSLALLARAKACSGFVAFVSILGGRARGGRSLEAFQMLRAIGAPAELANRIVDAWPQEVDLLPLSDFGFRLEDLEAMWLARTIDRIEAYDWPEILSRAIEATSSSKASGSTTR